MGSFAAAHGCGPALVRRVTRVGTGWRLHVLVAQRQRRQVEGLEVAGSNPAGHTDAPGSSDRAGPCTSGSRGWHLAGALMAGCSVGRGRPALNRVSDAGSIPARPARALRIGVRRPWYGGAARLDTGEGLHATVVSAVST